MYIAGSASGNSGGDASETEKLRQYGNQIMRDVAARSESFTIAGVASTPSGKYDFMLFSPGSRSAEKIGMPELVDMAEYTVADNEVIDEYREYCIEVLAGSAIDSVIMIMDTSKIENTRSILRLLSALYLIVIAAALLIGAFLCSLIILQSSKEAAMLRILGTTKTKTRVILSLEQVLLSTAGLILGACIMLIITKYEMEEITGELALFSALYFAIITASGVFCSFLTTRKSALELLQTKE
jgi:ABC-type lipoprotein release transport system permease subunit